MTISPGTFDAVPIGLWNLRVDALDLEEVVRFTGETLVNVQPGTVEVNLVLNTANGTIVINVTWGTGGGGTGESGNALQLDGSGDLAIVPEPAVLPDLEGTMTMEAWVRAAYDDYSPVMAQGYFTFGIEAADLLPGYFFRGLLIDQSGSYNNWGRLHFAPRFTSLVWTHIAIVHEQDVGVSGYINGQMVYQAGSIGTFDNEYDAGLDNTAFRIGGRVWNAGTGETVYLTGQLDEVRVWNVARTGAQIFNNYRQPLTGTEPGLIGYWNFDEEPGVTQVMDSSPSGNHADLVGNAQIVTSTAF